MHIKRPDIAIDTLAHIRGNGINAHLIIAGPDEEGLVKTLRMKAEELQCGNSVYFTGLLNDRELLYAYADSDLFIMPSEIQENFGMSALEAMAAGLPILVSKGVPVGHWAEIAGAGRVLPCNTLAFAQAAEELIKSPNEIKQLGMRGRDLVEKKFEISVIARWILAQFNSIIKFGMPVKDDFFAE